MSDTLSNEEIEALLGSLASDAQPATSPSESSQEERTKSMLSDMNTGGMLSRKPATRAAVAYEIYDFRRPDKFSKDQLRTLQMLHDTFARLAGSALSATLRTIVNVELISLEQVPYEEYLRSISSSVFTIMAIPPLSGQAVLEMEFGLIFSIIDKMLGGPGKSINRNVLTDIERPLVRTVIERLFNALKTAWEGIVVVNPGIDGMETSAQFVQIAPPSDIVITILFEVRMGTQRHAMSLCIPYLLLKPITTKLSAQRWFVSTNKRHSGANRIAISQQVVRSQVECSVKLGTSKVLMRDFINLKLGDTLRLDQKTKDDLPLEVEHVPKFLGRPALSGKKIVYTVSHIVEQ